MAKKDRTWYEAMGVDDPKHEPHISEEKLEEILSKQVLHTWQQRGASLYCTTCPNGHMTEPMFVDQLLIGQDDDGNPIFKQLTN